MGAPSPGSSVLHQDLCFSIVLCFVLQMCPVIQDGASTNQWREKKTCDANVSNIPCGSGVVYQLLVAERNARLRLPCLTNPRDRGTLLPVRSSCVVCVAPYESGWLGLASIQASRWWERPRAFSVGQSHQPRLAGRVLAFHFRLGGLV